MAVQQASPRPFGIEGGGEPLYIFYDIEATGLYVGRDNIIEIAAVVYTKNMRRRPRAQDQEFASLCYSRKDLCNEAKQLTGLTKRDLRDEPKLWMVLERFFDWISATVKQASEGEQKNYVPVLAAHSGRLLDFPMLFHAVKQQGRDRPVLKTKFNELNLHYVDTFSTFKELSAAGNCPELKTFGLKDIYNNYFVDTVDGHRALKDAKILRKIFSEGPKAQLFMSTLRKYIQSKAGLDLTREYIRKFHDIHIKVPKAIELLQKGIIPEDLEKGAQESEPRLRRFLKNTCNITEDEDEVVEALQQLQLSS